MRSWARIILLAELCITMSCASVLSVAVPKEYEYKVEKRKCGDWGRLGLIYGGIQGDASLISQSASEGTHAHQMIPAGVVLVWALLDLPLSGVLDTVFLPATIPWSLHRQSHAKILTEKVHNLSLDQRNQLSNENKDPCKFVNGDPQEKAAF